MKRVLLGLLVFSFLKIYGQIELIGDSYYKFVISGYQGIDPNACGNMYGLREINLFWKNYIPKIKKLQLLKSIL